MFWLRWKKRTGITFNYVVANNYADAINLREKW